ncbi:uncharacterized [Tachysurus ichikawai]
MENEELTRGGQLLSCSPKKINTSYQTKRKKTALVLEWLYLKFIMLGRPGNSEAFSHRLFVLDFCRVFYPDALVCLCGVLHCAILSRYLTLFSLIIIKTSADIHFCGLPAQVSLSVPIPSDCCLKQDS